MINNVVSTPKMDKKIYVSSALYNQNIKNLIISQLFNVYECSCISIEYIIDVYNLDINSIKKFNTQSQSLLAILSVLFVNENILKANRNLEIISDFLYYDIINDGNGVSIDYYDILDVYLLDILNLFLQKYPGLIKCRNPLGNIEICNLQKAENKAFLNSKIDYDYSFNICLIT